MNVTHTHTHTALPAYSVTRAFCKELLCETFTALLLPDNNPDNPTSSDCVLGAFKHTFNLAKEANADILGSQDYSKLLGAAVSTSDSGKCRVCCTECTCMLAVK